MLQGDAVSGGGLCDFVAAGASVLPPSKTEREPGPASSHHFPSELSFTRAPAKLRVDESLPLSLMRCDRPPSLPPITPCASLSSSSPSLTTTMVKEGNFMVGEYLVRLSLFAAQDPSSFPSLQLEISQGESHILSHNFSLQPSKEAGPDTPVKKRKWEGEEAAPVASFGLQGDQGDALKLPTGELKTSPTPQKRQKIEEGVDGAGKQEGTLVLQSHSQMQKPSGTERGEDVGILSLPVELLQHIFMHVPLRQMARLNEVCKQWESVVDNGPFWRHIFSRQFGIPLFLRLSWKQRTLACHRRAQIYELDLEGSIYGQLSWSAQYGYYQYFRNTIRKYSSSTRLPLKFDGDLVRFAASEGYCNVVESIMASHSVIELRDTMKRTGLHHATKYGKMEVAKMLISHDPQMIEEKDKYGDTPLILAACYGNTALVELLLSRGAKVDGKNQDDYTPLIFASQNGHTDIVEILLKHGADANARGNEGTSPLIIASQEGHADVVKLLLHHRPELNAQVNATGDTALILSICYGHAAVTECLLEAGANPNVQSLHGKTAVFYAASRGHLHTLTKLVQHGGLVNMLTVERATPLMAAAKAGHVPVVDFLLSQGASIDARDNSGKSALMLAVWHEKTEVVQLLLQHTVKGERERDGGNAIGDNAEEEARVSHILANKDERPIIALRTEEDEEEEEDEGYHHHHHHHHQQQDDWRRSYPLDEEEEDEDRGLMLDETMEDEEDEEEQRKPTRNVDTYLMDLTTTTTTTITTTLSSSMKDEEGSGNPSLSAATSQCASVSSLERADEVGDTVLMLAVKRKNRQLIRMLLESGADAVKSVDIQGRNALVLARTYGVADVIKPFLPPSLQLQLSIQPQPLESSHHNSRSEKQSLELADTDCMIVDNPNGMMCV